MDDVNKRKWLAVGKMALGAGRVASGIATATGHGLVGAALSRHHLTLVGVRLGKSSVEGGLKTLNEGLDDWKRANGRRDDEGEFA